MPTLLTGPAMPDSLHVYCTVILLESNHLVVPICGNECRVQQNEIGIATDGAVSQLV